MLVIEHRINTIEKLLRVPSSNGIEIDLRTYCDKVVLHHDPFQKGESFEDWLKLWRGQFLVLNVKEEGIEDEILKIMGKYQISDYFFLDQSFPFLQKTVNNGNKNAAVRVSDIESIETVLKTNCEWIWIDCFKGDWSFLPDVIKSLNGYERKTCLVSPELVRQNIDNEISELLDIIKKNELRFNAVCTKNPDRWKL
jgi:hypothetical protein